MDFSCPQGCTVSIGMSELHSRAGETCEPHGLRLTYGKDLKRTASSSPQGRARVGMKRGKGFAASKEQRAKVRDGRCLICGRDRFETVIDPAHLWSRARGGCDHADCVIPLCRHHHELFDTDRRDLLPVLISHGCWVELAHPILCHEVSPTQLIERLTGERWAPVPAPETPLREAV